VTAALALPSPATPVEITPAAARDLRWLEKALGRRWLGWRETGDALFGPVEIAIRRSSGRHVWFYGALEEAAAKARAAVLGVDGGAK
jgi:hypothetical protein